MIGRHCTGNAPARRRPQADAPVRRGYGVSRNCVTIPDKPPTGRIAPQRLLPIMENLPSDRFVVICLCAQWCGTCRDYQAGFTGLRESFPEIDFRWLDIEDEAEQLGDIDVENFPTLFVRRGDSVLFFGTLLPHPHLLRRLLETFVEQTPAQSSDYARSAADRLAWQHDPDLIRLGRSR